MDSNFYLNDLEISEPVGWDSFEQSLKRDDNSHGMQFEASTAALQYYGAAADYLIEQDETNGVRADVVFRATTTCDGVTEEAYRGRLNFGKFAKTCGTTCLVTVPVEEEGCKVIFKARYDQKVDMDATVAFDKITTLPGYAQMGIPMTIPAKALQTSVDGSVANEGDSLSLELGPFEVGEIIIRPNYSIERYNSIATGQLKDPFGVWETSGSSFQDSDLTPQLLFEDVITCFAGNFTYDIRLKGSYLIENNSGAAFLQAITLKVVTWDAVGSIFADAIVVDSFVVRPAGSYPLPQIGTYDHTFAGTLALPDGIGFYAFVDIDMGGVFGDVALNNTFDKETYFTLQAVKLCPATESRVYLIHEALSHVVEAISNRCIRAYSEYYGRTDSQPFAFDNDGCGGLRLLTNGLLLRRAPDGKFFTSIKDLLEGLRGIDNIGFTIQVDPDLPMFFILRIEPVEYFYQDREVLSLDSIAAGLEETQEQLLYGRVLMGYKKWEVQNINGLDEPNSNREYRTSLETISNTLDATSTLVTGSYPIEVTRQQSFAATGAADTTYDNETFLIAITRNAYDFAVEQGGITSPANVFDPATLFNFRLTPARNMLRWFKSMANGYPTIGSTASKAFFSSGTGNYIAEGELTDPTCKLEATVLAENQDISVSSFDDPTEATPLWKPKYQTFTYPLSVAQYNTLRADPFGYISFTCGANGDVQKGFIQEIKFRPAQGMADFVLKIKY